VPIHAQIAALASYLSRLAAPTTVLVVSGNHDGRFTLCPWWDGPITRAQVEAQLGAAVGHRPERRVWV
jgi:predicted MPP superfamily phosphohydrolase